MEKNQKNKLKLPEMQKKPQGKKKERKAARKALQAARYENPDA